MGRFLVVGGPFVSDIRSNVLCFPPSPCVSTLCFHFVFPSCVSIFYFHFSLHFCFHFSLHFPLPLLLPLLPSLLPSLLLPLLPLLLPPPYFSHHLPPFTFHLPPFHLSPFTTSFTTSFTQQVPIACRFLSSFGVPRKKGRQQRNTDLHQSGRHTNVFVFDTRAFGPLLQ